MKLIVFLSIINLAWGLDYKPHVFESYPEHKKFELATSLDFEDIQINNCANCESVKLADYTVEGFKRLINFKASDVHQTLAQVKANGNERTFNSYSATTFRNHPLQVGEEALVVDYHFNYAHLFTYSLENSKIIVQIIETYPVSNGIGGLGNRRGSGATSPGIHYVYHTHTTWPQSKSSRENQAIYVKPTGPTTQAALGKDIEPSQGLQWWDAIMITGKRIRLAGLEQINTHTIRRSIVLHGTYEEGYIGMQKSGGCVRMLNEDVAELYERVQLGMLVNIVGSGTFEQYLRSTTVREATIGANNAPNKEEVRAAGCYFSASSVNSMIESDNYSKMAKPECANSRGRF